MRLLSYNIHKGIGGRDRRYRLERIIQVIEAENPDLVCLQEVDRHVAHDPARRPAQEAQRGASMRRPISISSMCGSRAGGYGNLVLSRWPLRTCHQISLRRKRRKPRGAQLAVVESPEGPLHLVHWHLGLAERERHWQVRHLLDHSLFHESAHLPTLIVGDFNDWLNTLARGPFAVPRLRPGDGPAVAVPLVPGLLAGRFARQGVCPRPLIDPPRPDRPLTARARRLRPPAARRRFPSAPSRCEVAPKDRCKFPELDLARRARGQPVAPGRWLLMPTEVGPFVMKPNA